MWAVKPKSSAWWPPPSMCVADITSLPTRHPSSGSTETSHLASPGSSHVTQISHDGRQFRHRVFPPQLPPWPPQRRWRWLEVRLPRPSESDAPRTGADLPKPEWQSWAQTLPTEERSQLGFHELADRGGGVCENQTHKWVKLESPCRDLGVCTSLKRWGQRVTQSQNQSRALTGEVLTVILLTAVQLRRRHRDARADCSRVQRITRSLHAT